MRAYTRQEWQRQHKLNTDMMRLKGQHIAGTYFGVKFAGTVEYTIANTLANFESCGVVLDAPISLLGESGRMFVLVTGDLVAAGTHTIEGIQP